MTRIRRVVKMGRMTIPARMRQILILIVDVTLSACYRLVRTNKLKRSVRMIERRRTPHICVMAGRTLMREARQNVSRIRRLIVLSLMARETIRVHQLVIAVNMALSALRCCMPAR